VRSLTLVVALSLLAACSPDTPSPPVIDRSPPLPANGTRERPFSGRGVITEIRDGIVQIDHETIPGFMVALTMDFPLDDPSMAGGLRVGQEVVFEVIRRPEDYRIIRIGPVGSAE
jgi:Copper binding periplasmic protein CusF